MSELNGALPDLQDRGQLALNTQQPSIRKPLIIGGFIVFSILLIGGVIKFWIHINDAQLPPVQKDQVAMPQTLDTSDNSLKTSMAQISQNSMQLQELQPQQSQQQLDNQMQALQPQQALDAQLKTMQQAHGGGSAQPVQTPGMRKKSGSVLVNLDSGQKTAEHESGPINDTLRGEYYPPGMAAIRPSRRFVLIHGTTIPCVLKTRIITDYKGLTVCQVSKDVYSEDGSTVLVERGSQVFGEQKIALLQGKRRVFINWTDIETPTGIRIRIDSLGTDALGAAGAEAWIDGHFAQRFGGAIMLSFLQDLFQTAANAASKNNTIVYSNSQQATTDMAAEALKTTINIPPTAYINQGTLMNVLVARDVDMSNVYD